MNVRVGISMVVLSVVITHGARAQIPSRLAGCLTRVLADARAHGARPAGNAWSGFLLEGESASFAVDLTEDGCVALVGVGETKIRDVDLFLHTAGGTEIAHDTSEDAHPFVRFCGARGARLFGTVRAYAGRGEILVARIDAAPATLGDLDAGLDGCSAAAAGVRTTPPELGPTPPELPVDEAVSRAVEPLRALGFVAEAGPVHRSLPSRESPLTIPAGCRAIVVASAGLAPVLAQLRDASGRVLAEQTAAEEPGVLRACTDGPAQLWMRSERAGDVAVATLRAPPPGRDAPPGLSGGAVVRYAEARARISADGLVPRALAWTFVRPSDSVTLPWTLRAGACVALAAVPDDEIADDDVDLLVAGADGRLLAWDVGVGSTPSVRTCADRDEVARVVVRHIGGALGEILVLAGEPR